MSVCCRPVRRRVPARLRQPPPPCSRAAPPASAAVFPRGSASPRRSVPARLRQPSPQCYLDPSESRLGGTSPAAAYERGRWRLWFFGRGRDSHSEWKSRMRRAAAWSGPGAGPPSVHAESSRRLAKLTTIAATIGAPVAIAVARTKMTVNTFHLRRQRGVLPFCPPGRESVATAWPVPGQLTGWITMTTRRSSGWAPPAPLRAAGRPAP
jgi:hypothetical protein